MQHMAQATLSAFGLTLSLCCTLRYAQGDSLRSSCKSAKSPEEELGRSVSSLPVPPAALA